MSLEDLIGQEEAPILHRCLLLRFSGALLPPPPSPAKEKGPK